MWPVLYLVPKNHLSALCGWFFGIQWPYPLSVLAVNIFIWITGSDPTEAENPVSDYTSINSFFTRKLKAGLRPIGEGLVSPVDGCLRMVTEVNNKEYIQVKGQGYSLEKLIGSSSGLERFEQGVYFNFYLAPHNYHRVHTPLAAEVIGYRHVPGKLWPVNDWSLNAIPNLFGVNERVIIYLKSKIGVYLVVLVGATNVGKIELAFDELKTNTQLSFAKRESVYVNKTDQNIALKKGSELATFNMGSSVLLFFESGALEFTEQLAAYDNVPVKIGQAL